MRFLRPWCFFWWSYLTVGRGSCWWCALCDGVWGTAWSHMSLMEGHCWCRDNLMLVCWWRCPQSGWALVGPQWCVSVWWMSTYWKYPEWGSACVVAVKIKSSISCHSPSGMSQMSTGCFVCMSLWVMQVGIFWHSLWYLCQCQGRRWLGILFHFAGNLWDSHCLAGQPL